MEPEAYTDAEVTLRHNIYKKLISDNAFLQACKEPILSDVARFKSEIDKLKITYLGIYQELLNNMRPFELAVSDAANYVAHQGISDG